MQKAFALRVQFCQGTVRHDSGQEFSGIQRLAFHTGKSPLQQWFKETMGMIAQMPLTPWHSSDCPRAPQQWNLKALPHSTAYPSCTQRAADTS